jgi:hypothetical protein
VDCRGGNPVPPGTVKVRPTVSATGPAEAGNPPH